MPAAEPGAGVPAPPAGRIPPWVVALLVLVAAAAATRFVRLGEPSKMIFDEIYYAKAAEQILAGAEVTEERTHPPLSKLIIAGGIALFGDRAVGWRVAGAAAGTLLVPLVYALAWLLFRNHVVAAAGALMTALDGLMLVESRIAKPDIFLTLFLVAAYAAFWMFVGASVEGPGRSRARPGVWLAVTGAAAGCAVTTKWTAAVPLLTLPVMMLLLSRWGRVAWSRRDLWRAAAALVLIPAGVYVVSYVPYFRLGHGARDLLTLQVSMFRFHAGLTEGHPYQSAWWSWPLLIRPIWYEYRETASHLYRGVVALGNPVLWWAGLPALAVVAAGAVRTRALPETFLVVGFLLSYAQYAAIPRVLFLYHFLPALPFVFIALAVVLERLRRQVGPGPVVALGLLAAAWLAAFYPVLTAVPMPDTRILRMMWFASWI
jgi:dolichyl-phosphate-mannose--protein O-mannosyl transferase